MADDKSTSLVLDHDMKITCDAIFALVENFKIEYKRDPELIEMTRRQYDALVCDSRFFDYVAHDEQTWPKRFCGIELRVGSDLDWAVCPRCQGSCGHCTYCGGTGQVYHGEPLHS